MLEVTFAELAYQFSAEFLRTHSPSAEVTGHGSDQPAAVHGKMHVRIDRIQPVGNYGIQVYFDDGHHSGIFSWQYFADLGEKQEKYWQHYLERLKQQRQHRDPEIRVMTIHPL